MSTVQEVPPRAVERRRAILREATELFRVKGFSETTMDDVAAAAGITKRTLYRYVKTKDQLLVDVHDEFSGSLARYEPVRFDDPVQQLAKLIERHVMIVTSQTAEIGVFFDERKYLSPEAQADISQRRRRYTSEMVEALEAGQQLGVIREIDTKVAARVILGAITEIYRWYQPGGRLTPAEIAEHATDLFLFGASSTPLDDSYLEATTRAGCNPDARRPAPLEAADKVREAATLSFAKLGYRASTIRELASVAGVTNGAVMYHAGYKHTLLEQIHLHTFQEGIPALERELRAGDGAATQLARLLGAQMCFLADHVAEIAVINENIKFLEPNAYRRVNRRRAKFLSIFDDVMQEGVRSGEFRTPDAQLMSRLVVGMINAPYRWFRPAGRNGPQGSASSADLAVVLSRVVLCGVSSLDRTTSKTRLDALPGA